MVFSTHSKLGKHALGSLLKYCLNGFTAKICLARGAYVYLCDIDDKSLKKLNKHPLKNKRLFAYHCDASIEDQVSDFFEKVKRKLKKLML